MRSEVVIVAVFILVLLGVGLIAFTRKRANPTDRTASAARSRGPASLHYVCGGCSAQFTHSRRTIAAWEKGTRRLFCGSCHAKWCEKQPAQRAEIAAVPTQSKDGAARRSPESARQLPAAPASRPSLAPSRGGCLTMIVVLVAVPIIIGLVAAYA
jgi:hypothetical protein